MQNEENKQYVHLNNTRFVYKQVKSPYAYETYLKQCNVLALDIF